MTGSMPSMGRLKMKGHRNPIAKAVRGLRGSIVPSGKLYKRERFTVANASLAAAAYEHVTRDDPIIAELLRDGRGFLASYLGADLARIAELQEAYATAGDQPYAGFWWEHDDFGEVTTLVILKAAQT